MDKVHSKCGNTFDADEVWCMSVRLPPMDWKTARRHAMEQGYPREIRPGGCFGPAMMNEYNTEAALQWANTQWVIEFKVLGEDRTYTLRGNPFPSKEEAAKALRFLIIRQPEIQDDYSS